MDKKKIKIEISQITNKLIGKKINPNINFLKSGIIDSFSYVELLISLEQKFKIKIKKKEQMNISLQSINGLIRFINKKLSEKRKNY